MNSYNVNMIIRDGKYSYNEDGYIIASDIVKAIRDKPKPNRKQRRQSEKSE